MTRKEDAMRTNYMMNVDDVMEELGVKRSKAYSILKQLNDELAQERYEVIEAQMRSAEGVTEELKVQNPMEWVRQCNNIRNRVQEIVLSELVYV